MNELLSVVLDFNVDVIATLDLEQLISSVLKFLNCFKMQSGLNQSRIYLAFASNSYLVYPLEGVISTDTKLASKLVDSSKMNSLSFTELKERMLDRISAIIESEALQREEEKAGTSATLIHQAIMKAVCYSQHQIRLKNQGSLASSQSASQQAQGSSDQQKSQAPSSDCRILVIQLGKDNPAHFNALVNAVFACQKLKISLDCLVLDELRDGEAAQQFVSQLEGQEAKQRAAMPSFRQDCDIHLLQQAANLTGGLYWRIPRQSDVFPFLVQAGYLSNQSLRPNLILPMQSELVMTTYCVCCSQSQSVGHACSHCLTFHCEKERTKCRVCQRIFVADKEEQRPC